MQRQGGLVGVRALLALGLAAAAAGTGPAWGKEPAETVVAFRSRPAVLLIGVEVGATAQVHCGRGDPVAARPNPLSWIGSGFIIHPDGWAATNGHVVRPAAEQNDQEYLPKLLEAAVAQACGPALEGLDSVARAARIRALASHPANRSGIKIEKKVQVIMGNGKRFPAEIKLYSPPAFVQVGTTRDASGAERKEYGKDVAILKFEGKDLPVVRLAKDTRRLHVGEEMVVIGFPSVVVQHEMLSRDTEFVPSVTFGRVSGLREDVGENRVFQTDAAIIQGNSGGPVFNLAAQVIGAATFTSLQGDQVVQGFNFLIPVETIHEAAQKAGVTPQPDSAFMRLWDQGIRQYQKGKYRSAYDSIHAAGEMFPGFPIVTRVKEDIDAQYADQDFLEREGVQRVLMWVGLVAALVILWLGGRWASRALTRRIRSVVHEELGQRGAAPGA